LEKKKYKRVVWINLREEPVIYVGGMTFAPRDKDTLNINLEYLLGIEGLDLEAMEGRLKADIIASSKEQKGKFTYYTQNATMGNDLQEMTIIPGSNSLKTLREMYDELRMDYKFNVDYYRIPITDELAPEEKDFDELITVLKETMPNTSVVFNCQMGRGRTTTGLVCAFLMSQIMTGDWVPKGRAYIDYENPNFERGEYQVVLKLITALPDGELVKAQVDEAIDACEAMQNLRSAICECQKKQVAAASTDKQGPEFWQKRGLNYLERYWWLIVFNAYLRKHAPSFRCLFSEWMKGMWKLRRLLRKIELQ